MESKPTKQQIEEQDRALFKKLQQMLLKIPKDPFLYASQVAQYGKMFQEIFVSLTSDTQRKNEKFGQLITFLSRCSPYYSKSLNFLAPYAMDLLNNYGSILHPYNRRKAVSCIFILRAKNILFPASTVQFLLKLINLQDKPLRKAIFKYVLNDLKRMNKYNRNQKINQTIKSFIQGYINTHSDKVAQKCIQLMIELYKQNIWTDNRSVNIISQGCLNASPKIRLLSAYFLLSTTQRIQEIPQSSQDQVEIKKLKGITKNTRNKLKAQEKQKKKHARKLRRKQIVVQKTNFMPIDVLYSPQQFCEKIFNIASAKDQKFSHRLVFMSLIARMIWRHSLIVLPFYGFLIKYMQPHQKEVHRVLAAFAEAVHSIVPDDDLQAVLNHIVEKFVNDKCSQFAMTIGLNTIRQVLAKMPSLISQELLLYLCTYYDYKNKNVSMAAKSLINLVRSIDPNLLEKKYRGKPGQIQPNGIKTQPNLVYSINGAQLLPNDSNVPIYMDKILTDQDFKMIRKLNRKKQLENQNKPQQIQQQEQQQQEGQQQQRQQQNSELDSEQNSEDQQEIEIQDYEFEQQKSDQEQSQQQQQDDDEEQEDEQDQQNLDWGDVQQMQQEGSKKRNHKEAFENEQEQSNSEIQEEDDDQNPHGFIPLNRIAYYKKSKTEIKAEKRNGKDNQPKFKHKPKEKGGGTNNKQKQKLKPLLMLRAKKNKLRNRQKQVKTRIKDLKNKLGKIRSGKQAKRLKNKKVKPN